MRQVDVILKNRAGEDVTYHDVTQVMLRKPDESTAPFSYGDLQTGNITLDFTRGDQVVDAPDDKLYNQVVVLMPDTFKAENIAEGVEIAGVIGTFEGAGDKPKLRTVSISRNGDTISISNPSTNGNFGQKFRIFSDDTVVREVTTSTTSFSIVSFNTHGTINFSVTIFADLFQEADHSSTITVTTYSLLRQLQNMTSTSSAALIVQNLTHSTTLKPTTGKFIPEDIEVTMDGSPCEYTWDNGTGSLSIPNIIGDVVITAVADDIYQIRRPGVEIVGYEIFVKPRGGAKHTKIYIDGVEVHDIETEFFTEVLPISGVPYGFALNASGYYESTNKNLHSTYAMCQIVVYTNTERSLRLQCINYAESNYDYGIISQPNKTLARSTADDGSSGTTTVFRNFKGQSSTAVVTLDIPIPIGESVIEVKYRKDGSVSSGNDSLQFKIVEEE